MAEVRLTMSIFKCKMCGGTIEFEQGATVGVCDSCGTKQTLPRLDDDRWANLYDRANHFRRNNEFDKAMGIYEQILNEDNTDAEAYWSLVLCRYGIEYVEDPLTHRRLPTVNRAQFTSIFDDDNYQSAIRYADPAQKALYYEEAQTINEIQRTAKSYIYTGKHRKYQQCSSCVPASPDFYVSRRQQLVGSEPVLRKIEFSNNSKK